MEIVENIDPAFLCNMAGENFDLMAHCELLTPDWDELIYDKLRDKDGYNFYAPIASGNARKEDHNVHAPKLKLQREIGPTYIHPISFVP